MWRGVRGTFCRQLSGALLAQSEIDAHSSWKVLIFTSPSPIEYGRCPSLSHPINGTLTWKPRKRRPTDRQSCNCNINVYQGQWWGSNLTPPGSESSVLTTGLPRLIPNSILKVLMGQVISFHFITLNQWSHYR